MKLRALLGVAVIGAVGMVAPGVAGASNAPTEYFTGIQTSLSGAQTVTAVGPLSATGTDVETSKTTDQYDFPDGSLMIRHHAIATTKKTDGPACSFVFLQTGTYVITGGTGAYTHALGSGTFRVHGIIADCKGQPPTEIAITIEAHGPLTLG